MKAFSEIIEKIDCQGRAKQFFDLSTAGEWDAFLIDSEAIPQEFADPVAFIEKLGAESSILLVGSDKFDEWHDQLEALGAIVLHKPTTIGEIGLALRKISARKDPDASRESA